METLVLDRQSLVQEVLNRIQSDMVRVNESGGIITIEPVLDSDRQERLPPTASADFRPWETEGYLPIARKTPEAELYAPKQKLKPWTGPTQAMLHPLHVDERLFRKAPREELHER
jgi:hypothetical protein